MIKPSDYHQLTRRKVWLRTRWARTPRCNRGRLYFVGVQTRLYPEEQLSGSLYRGQGAIRADSTFTFRNYSQETLQTGEEKEQFPWKLPLTHLLPTRTATSSQAVTSSYVRKAVCHLPAIGQDTATEILTSLTASARRAAERQALGSDRPLPSKRCWQEEEGEQQHHSSGDSRNKSKGSIKVD